MSSDPGKFYSIFDYLEDKAIEKDKAGKKIRLGCKSRKVAWLPSLGRVV